MSTDAGRRMPRPTLATENGVQLDAAAHRRARRYRTFLAGRIRLADGRFVLCVVRDMSKTGARLVVDPSAELSLHVELHVLSRNELFSGSIVWREEELAGMNFTDWKRI